jgi:hypothetical protein
MQLVEQVKRSVTRCGRAEDGFGGADARLGGTGE